MKKLSGLLRTALGAAAAVALAALMTPAPAVAQAPTKLTIVVFSFPSLGAFMPPIIKAKKFDAATQTKSYDATPEQKKMLKKNRNDFDTEFAQAKAQLDAGTPLKRLSQLGIRREVMEALTKVELAKSKAKTNGTKH